MKQQADPGRNERLHAVDAVAVGASAGGVDALLALLTPLPAGWRLPVVVVLHLPEQHESRLAQLFAPRVSVPVREAQDKMPFSGGGIFFAPPGYHLSIERDRCFSLSCEPPVQFSRPSIDVLMGSAADVFGRRIAGVLLTGANSDGAEGLTRIHAAGGLSAVQDPATAQVPTMPLAAIARHRPDYVLPVRALREWLLNLDALHAP